MNPMIFDSSVEETYRKFMVLDQMMKSFGLDVLDEQLLERITELTSIYQKSK